MLNRTFAGFHGLFIGGNEAVYCRKIHKNQSLDCSKGSADHDHLSMLFRIFAVYIKLGQVMSYIDHNAESVSTFNKYADRYADKYFGLTQYDIYYEMLASRLPPTGAKFIDIACGPGNVAAYVRKARQDAVIYCVDDSQNMLDEAVARVPKIQPVKLDCRKLHNIDETFDGAAFFFGLNYLNDDDCILLFKALRRILKPNGVLLIATITGEPSDTGYQANNSGDRVYMIYRTPSVVRALLESSGFNCLIFHNVDSPDNSTQKTNDIVALTTYVGLTPHSSGTPKDHVQNSRPIVVTEARILQALAA